MGTRPVQEGYKSSTQEKKKKKNGRAKIPGPYLPAEFGGILQQHVLVHVEGVADGGLQHRVHAEQRQLAHVALPLLVGAVLVLALAHAHQQFLSDGRHGG